MTGVPPNNSIQRTALSAAAVLNFGLRASVTSFEAGNASQATRFGLIRRRDNRHLLGLRRTDTPTRVVRRSNSRKCVLGFCI